MHLLYILMHESQAFSVRVFIIIEFAIYMPLRRLPFVKYAHQIRSAACTVNKIYLKYRQGDDIMLLKIMNKGV